jgi:hypothetical protein
MGDLGIEVLITSASFAEARHHFLALQLNSGTKVITTACMDSLCAIQRS